MQKHKWVFVACLLLLAILISGCAPSTKIKTNEFPGMSPRLKHVFGEHCPIFGDRPLPGAYRGFDQQLVNAPEQNVISPA
jgi:hypothetical protein